ncbi:MAG: hypothetical protein ACE5IJ_03685 [Thermoplasmata archaeon]
MVPTRRVFFELHIASDVPARFYVLDWRLQPIFSDLRSTTDKAFSSPVEAEPYYFITFITDSERFEFIRIRLSFIQSPDYRVGLFILFEALLVVGLAVINRVLLPRLGRKPQGSPRKIEEERGSYPGAGRRPGRTK